MGMSIWDIYIMAVNCLKNKSKILGNQAESLHRDRAIPFEAEKSTSRYIIVWLSKDASTTFVNAHSYKRLMSFSLPSARARAYKLARAKAASLIFLLINEGRRSGETARERFLPNGISVSAECAHPSTRESRGSSACYLTRLFFWNSCSYILHGIKRLCRMSH